MKSSLPERLCVLTGETAETAELIRFVLSPDEKIVPDIAAKLPGRGFWIAARKSLINQAVASGSFVKKASRALKRPVSGSAVPSDLAEVIEQLLRTRCLNLLGLERRRGGLVLGYDAVISTVRAGKAALLIAAADGASVGRDKLRRRAEKAAKPVQIFDLFSRDELSLALGRENVVHAAVKPGRTTKVLARELAYLALYRSSSESVDRSVIEG